MPDNALNNVWRQDMSHEFVWAPGASPRLVLGIRQRPTLPDLHPEGVVMIRCRASGEMFPYLKTAVEGSNQSDQSDGAHYLTPISMGVWNEWLSHQSVGHRPTSTTILLEDEAEEDNETYYVDAQEDLDEEEDEEDRLDAVVMQRKRIGAMMQRYVRDALYLETAQMHQTAEKVEHSTVCDILDKMAENASVVSTSDWGICGQRPARIPEEFFCPISLMAMKDPVVCDDGVTYDVISLAKWLKQHKWKDGAPKSPVTNVRFQSIKWYKNMALKSMMQCWLWEHCPGLGKAATSAHGPFESQQCKLLAMKAVVSHYVNESTSSTSVDDGNVWQMGTFPSYCSSMRAFVISGMAVQRCGGCNRIHVSTGSVGDSPLLDERPPPRDQQVRLPARMTSPAFTRPRPVQFDRHGYLQPRRFAEDDAAESWEHDQRIPELVNEESDCDTDEDVDDYGYPNGPRGHWEPPPLAEQVQGAGYSTGPLPYTRWLQFNGPRSVPSQPPPAGQVQDLYYWNGPLPYTQWLHHYDNIRRQFHNNGVYHYNLARGFEPVPPPTPERLDQRFSAH